MRFLASLIVAAYVLLHAFAWPLPFSLSRTSPRTNPRIGSRNELLSSVEAARAYLHEAETEFYAFTSSGKGSSAVTVSHTISDAQARIKSGAQAALTMDRKEMTADMRHRVNEWMRVLGEERCGDKSGCE